MFSSTSFPAALLFDCIAVDHSTRAQLFPVSSASWALESDCLTYTAHNTTVASFVSAADGGATCYDTWQFASAFNGPHTVTQVQCQMRAMMARVPENVKTSSFVLTKSPGRITDI
jgi:hypothetical protein